MMFGTASFTWEASGSISYTVSPARTVPAFVPNVADISILVVLFVLMAVLACLSGIAAAVPALFLSVPRWLRRRQRSIREAHKKGSCNNSQVPSAGENKSPLPFPCYTPFQQNRSFYAVACDLIHPVCPSDAGEPKAASLAWPASATGAALDAAILALMLAAGVSYVAALVLEMGMTAQTSYPIYDDITTSTARYFMPSKTEADPDPVVDAEVTAADATDDDPKRWSLPDDETGIDDMSEMVASMAYASSIISLSTSLHGIALLLAVIRMLYSFTFQPRFGIITKTLVRCAPGLIDLMVLTSLVLVLLASLAHLVLGDLYDELSTMKQSVYFVFFFLLTGDLGDMKAAVAPFYEGLERNTVSVVVSYIVYSALPLLVGYVLLSFILAVIFESYYAIKTKSGAMPSMFDEVGKIVSGRKRLRLVRNGLSAAGMQGQEPEDFCPVVGPTRVDKVKPKPSAVIRGVNDKRMIARLSVAIEILAERGIPSKDEESRAGLSSYGRLLDLVARNEALLSDVSEMVAETERMNEVMRSAMSNPTCMVNATLHRNSVEMVSSGLLFDPADAWMAPVDEVDEEEEHEEEESDAGGAEHDELEREARQRVATELKCFKNKIAATHASSRDLFDELFDISSAARPISRQRPSSSRQSVDELLHISPRGLLGARPSEDIHGPWRQSGRLPAQRSSMRRFSEDIRQIRVQERPSTVSSGRVMSSRRRISEDTTRRPAAPQDAPSSAVVVSDRGARLSPVQAKALPVSSSQRSSMRRFSEDIWQQTSTVQERPPSTVSARRDGRSSHRRFSEDTSRSRPASQDAPPSAAVSDRGTRMAPASSRRSLRRFSEDTRPNEPSAVLSMGEDTRLITLLSRSSVSAVAPHRSERRFSEDVRRSAYQASLPASAHRSLRRFSEDIARGPSSLPSAANVSSRPSGAPPATARAPNRSSFGSFMRLPSSMAASAAGAGSSGRRRHRGDSKSLTGVDEAHHQPPVPPLFTSAPGLAAASLSGVKRPGTAQAMIDAARVRREAAIQAAHKIRPPSPAQQHRPHRASESSVIPVSRQGKSGTRRASTARTADNDEPLDAVSSPADGPSSAMTWGSWGLNQEMKVEEVEEASSSTSVVAHPHQTSSSPPVGTKSKEVMQRSSFYSGSRLGMSSSSSSSPIGGSPRGGDGEQGGNQPISLRGEKSGRSSARSNTETPEETLPGMPFSPIK